MKDIHHNLYRVYLIYSYIFLLNRSQKMTFCFLSSIYLSLIHILLKMELKVKMLFCGIIFELFTTSFACLLVDLQLEIDKNNMKGIIYFIVYFLFI